MEHLFEHLQDYKIDKKSEKDKLKYYKNEITKLCQETEPKITKTWVHWRITNNVYPCKADDVEKLYYLTLSKAKHDRISFEFAFKVLTKK